MKEENGGALLHMLLWLGLVQDQTEWTRCIPGGEIVFLAETYENQVFLPWGTKRDKADVLGQLAENESWTTHLMSRPKWSDARGKIKLTREMFEPVPVGWEWAGDWVIWPELSVEFNDPEAMLSEYTEEVYEHYTRKPRRRWSENPSDSIWCDPVSHLCV